MILARHICTTIGPLIFFPLITLSASALTLRASQHFSVPLRWLQSNFPMSVIRQIISSENETAPPLWPAAAVTADLISNTLSITSRLLKVT